MFNLYNGACKYINTDICNNNNLEIRGYQFDSGETWDKQRWGTQKQMEKEKWRRKMV